MNPSLPSLFEAIKFIFIVIDISLFALFIYVLSQSFPLRPRLGRPQEREKKILTLGNLLLRKHWQAVLTRFSAGSPESLKLAIIEADQLADEVLKRLGLEGEHMADRLEQLTPEDFSALEKLWQAHRVRNQLVHEPDFKISDSEAGKTLDAYEAFLKEVGVI